MRTYLKTQRVRLRHVTLDDAGDLYALDADAAVLRFLNDGTPTPMEHITERMIPFWIEYYDRYPGYGWFIAETIDNNTFLGWFHFRPAKTPPHDIELGYRLVQHSWNKGYATEVSRALLAKGFGEMGLSCVVARTLAANTASRRVMEKIGMHLTSEYIEEAFSGADKRAAWYGINVEEFALSQDPIVDRQ